MVEREGLLAKLAAETRETLALQSHAVAPHPADVVAPTVIARDLLRCWARRHATSVLRGLRFSLPPEKSKNKQNKQQTEQTSSPLTPRSLSFLSLLVHMAALLIECKAQTSPTGPSFGVSTASERQLQDEPHTALRCGDLADLAAVEELHVVGEG